MGPGFGDVRRARPAFVPGPDETGRLALRGIPPGGIACQSATLPPREMQSLRRVKRVPPPTAVWAGA